MQLVLDLMHVPELFFLRNNQLSHLLLQDLVNMPPVIYVQGKN